MGYLFSQIIDLMHFYRQTFIEDGLSQNDGIFLWNGLKIVKFAPRDFTQITITEYSQKRQLARIVYLKGKFIYITINK